MASRCVLSKTEKKLMSDAAVLQKVQELTKAVEHLQERVEDLEDLRDLQAAIAENANEPLIPWAQAKAELDLD
jgi:cell division protein FtsB